MDSRVCVWGGGWLPGLLCVGDAYSCGKGHVGQGVGCSCGNSGVRVTAAVAVSLMHRLSELIQALCKWPMCKADGQSCPPGGWVGGGGGRMCYVSTDGLHANTCMLTGSHPTRIVKQSCVVVVMVGGLVERCSHMQLRVRRDSSMVLGSSGGSSRMWLVMERERVWWYCGCACYGLVQARACRG